MHPETIIAPAFFGMVAFVMWVLVSGWQRHQQFRLEQELNSRLLDRLGSVKDFADLLQTESGARLVQALTQHGTVSARDRILRAAQTGVVSIALGLGFLFLGWRIDDDDVLTGIGVIVLSLGLGLLISCGVSYWMARMLGAFDAHQDYGSVRRLAQ